MDARAWVEDALRDNGHHPLPLGCRLMTETGFTVAEGPHPGTATLTATARFTGQDAYDHWDEAQELGHRLLDVLERLGATSEEVHGREPNHVVTVYPPSDRSD